MKIKLLFIIAGFTLLAGCSDGKEHHDTLMGYKRTLDTAKSVMSMAEENEKKKQQALQETQQ